MAVIPPEQYANLDYIKTTSERKSVAPLEAQPTRASRNEQPPCASVSTQISSANSNRSGSRAHDSFRINCVASIESNDGARLSTTKNAFVTFGS